MLCDAGNYQHAVVHSTCVLEHQPNNVKALYRRGACQVAPSPFPAPLRTHTHAHVHAPPLAAMATLLTTYYLYLT